MLAAMSATQLEVLHALAAGVDALTRTFVIAGRVELDAPVRLMFRDGAAIELGPGASGAGLDALLDRLAPAPVGKGRATVVDPAVRQALSRKAAGVFTVEGLGLSGVLAEVGERLTPGSSVAAELLDVHAYGPGGHFEAHKDTPRGADMLGTLVVCLPAGFRGGALRVGEGEEQVEIDWAAASERPAAQWAAFFADVDHAIAPVTRGLRVTLTYVLRGAAQQVDAPGSGPPKELTEAFAAAARTIAGPRTLVIPCRHLYADSAMRQDEDGKLAALRGRDREVMRAALAAGLRARVRPYLALGARGDAPQLLPLERVPAVKDLARLPAQVGPDALDAWLEDDAGVTLEVPVAGWQGRHVATREYSETGYFGNEGAELDFYVCAGVEVELAALDPARGRRVRHAKFGAGEVLRSEPREGDELLEVRFDDGATRRLLGRFLSDV